VAGFIAALESDAGIGEVINIGSNFEISIGNTAKAIAEVMSVELDIITDEQRLRPESSEVERLWASNDKARKILGWQPQFGGLEGFKRGLVQTVDWFRNPAHLAAYKSDMYNL
jgi:dTDP-glucose 4,6-dehydratase